MKKIYYRHERWEDFHAGMFNKHGNRQIKVIQSEELLSRPRSLYEQMKAVSIEWPYAAEMNLTNLNRNRQAWLGQSSCCYNHGATEDETKEAWGNLPYKTRKIANEVADQIIKEWVLIYNYNLCQKSTQTRMF